MCPGYTSNLPQVIEAASCYQWWDKGQLTARLGGEQPTTVMVDAIDILHSAVGAVQSKELRDARERNNNVAR